MCNDGWESEGAGVTAAAGMAERPLESAAAGMSERPLEMAAGGPELLGKQAGLDATTVEDQLRVGNKKEKGDSLKMQLHTRPVDQIKSEKLGKWCCLPYKYGYREYDPAQNKTYFIPP